MASKGIGKVQLIRPTRGFVMSKPSGYQNRRRARMPAHHVGNREATGTGLR